MKDCAAIALTAALCVAVIVAGCGSRSPSEGEGSATTAVGQRLGPRLLGRKQFQTRAKGLCDQFNEQRNEQMSTFLQRRAHESGESLGLVGEVEAIEMVVVPSLRTEIEQLESIGLPRGEVYEAEALWQTLRIVLREVEVEGIYAWRSAKLLTSFRNRAKQFGLQLCVSN